MFVSSAYKIGNKSLETLTKSLTYNKNNKGPKM